MTKTDKFCRMAVRTICFVKHFDAENAIPERPGRLCLTDWYCRSFIGIYNENGQLVLSAG